ncbi:MAG TPA: GNAT family N-acetyltransferase [Stellaceae bacterium]|nr:GNAT family N-acetyltransferase [Stellaceae bacterium]
MPDPIIELTDTATPEELAVVSDGLRAYNTSRAGYDDYRRLAIFVKDPETGAIIGGIYGGSYLGQLSIERVFLSEPLRRYRLGSRLIALAEEEARRRGCSRITLNTLEIQARGFYLKQGFETAATLACDPPGITRYVMTKKLT